MQLLVYCNHHSESINRSSFLTSISREEVEWIDVREVVAAVHLDGLQESDKHPQPDQCQVVAEHSHSDEETSPEN